jgi:alpha-1,6-mannosyltransferase
LTSAAEVAAHTSVPAFDLLNAQLPAPLRPAATLRLLDITKYFGPDTGGIRTYLLAKGEWLEADPSVARILVVPGEADRIQDGDGRTYRVRGPRMPGQRTYRWLLDSRKLRRILRHERPSLIELGSSLAVPFVTSRARRGLNIPLVWFYHTHLPRIVNPAGERGAAWRRVGERVAWWHVRRIGDRCAATLAASESLARELEIQGVPRVRRIRLGVDLELFHPMRRAASEAVRARLALPSGPLALYAGRFTPEKQLATVLEAWAEVHRQTAAALVLIGHGPEEARLRSRYAQAGVCWRPFEPDRARLADLLAAADCYIAPGPAETFGLSALEALASGTPVLSVARGGAAELVECSAAGRLYPVADASGCAAQCAALLAESASLRMRARAHAEARHAWPDVLAELLACYRELAAPARAD